MPVTIVLADNHPVVREGLKLVLRGHEDLCVIGDTGDGLEAVNLATHLRPDVLIVEITLPGLHGLEVIRQVHQRLPHTRIMVLSAHANEHYMREALRSGATGYVLKAARLSELLQAVRTVAAQQRYLSPPLSARMVEGQQQSHHTEMLDPYETLTPREREVLSLAAEGHTNARIAGILGISRRTVETHRAHLMRKLNLRTPAELVRYALHRDIVPG